MSSRTGLLLLLLLTDVMTSHRFNDFIERIFSGESMVFASICPTSPTNLIRRYFNK